MEIWLTPYRPLDTFDFDQLIRMTRLPIATIEKRLGVAVERNISFEGETATFQLGYTELGDIMVQGRIEGDRVDHVIVVVMCPVGAMNRLLARMRRLAPKLVLVPTYEDILEVRRR